MNTLKGVLSHHKTKILHPEKYEDLSRLCLDSDKKSSFRAIRLIVDYENCRYVGREGEGEGCFNLIIKQILVVFQRCIICQFHPHDLLLTISCRCEQIRK